VGFKMDAQEVDKIRKLLLQSWSGKTSLCFENAEHSSYGQCAQTAIVIKEIYGGEILKTSGWKQEKGYGLHFYNRIDGVNYDFTSEQFSMPSYSQSVLYEDKESSIEEAMQITNNLQVMYLKSAFLNAISENAKSNR
jgi:hypothetical protein